MLGSSCACPVRSIERTCKYLLYSAGKACDNRFTFTRSLSIGELLVEAVHLIQVLFNFYNGSCFPNYLLPHYAFLMRLLGDTNDLHVVFYVKFIIKRY